MLGISWLSSHWWGTGTLSELWEKYLDDLVGSDLTPEAKGGEDTINGEDDWGNKVDTWVGESLDNSQNVAHSSESTQDKHDPVPGVNTLEAGLEDWILHLGHSVLSVDGLAVAQPWEEDVQDSEATGGLLSLDEVGDVNIRGDRGTFWHVLGSEQCQLIWGDFWSTHFILILLFYRGGV